MLKRMAHLIEKQTQDLKAFTEGLLKNIFKEIQDGKEDVFNRIDGPITVVDDSTKQDWKSSAEEKSEILEMEKGVSEPRSPDKDTLFKKAHSHFKATVHKNQPKDTWISFESNRFKGASQEKNCTDIGVQEVQLPQGSSVNILRKRIQEYKRIRQSLTGQNISLREQQDAVSLDMRPP